MSDDQGYNKEAVPVQDDTDSHLFSEKGFCLDCGNYELIHDITRRCSFCFQIRKRRPL